MCITNLVSAPKGDAPAGTHGCSLLREKMFRLCNAGLELICVRLERTGRSSHDIPYGQEGFLSQPETVDS